MSDEQRAEYERKVAARKAQFEAEVEAMEREADERSALQEAAARPAPAEALAEARVQLARAEANLASADAEDAEIFEGLVDMARRQVKHAEEAVAADQQPGPAAGVPGPAPVAAAAPVAGMPPAAPMPPPVVHPVALTLEQYAGLCVERRWYPGHEAAIAPRYSVPSPAALQALDSQWREWLRDPGLAQRFQQACADFEAWARQGR